MRQSWKFSIVLSRILNAVRHKINAKAKRNPNLELISMLDVTTDKAISRRVAGRLAPHIQPEYKVPPMNALIKMYELTLE